MKDEKYLVLCRGCARVVNSLRSALDLASKKEIQGFSVRIYRTIINDYDGYDTLICIYYTEVKNGKN